ncbi:MAG: hypothetical protein RLZZ598_1327, partial [Pseudomonadota bacterium]
MSDGAESHRYRRLAGQLLRWVATSDLRPGAAFPSVRALMRDHAVSMQVARRALGVLERDGIIACQQGRTTRLTRIPGLTAGSTQRLDLLFISLDHDEDDAFYDQVLDGFSECARNHGINVFFRRCANEVAELDDAIERFRPSGVALAGAAAPELLDWLRVQDLPTVTAGAPREQPPDWLSWVGSDEPSGVQLLTQHLVAMGHRRIAWIGPPAGAARYADERFAGYAAGLRLAGIAPDPALIIRHAGFARDDGNER